MRVLWIGANAGRATKLPNLGLHRIDDASFKISQKMLLAVQRKRPIWYAEQERSSEPPKEIGKFRGRAA